MSEEERKRHWDYNINKVYIVCFLNYVMAPGYPDKYRWDVVRMDRELKVPFSETLNQGDRTKIPLKSLSLQNEYL